MSTRLEELREAVKNNNVELLKTLLTPQNVNSVDVERRMTLLMIAVSFRNHSAAELLLNHGASLYPYDMFQFNVFHYAAWCCDVKMMEILLFPTFHHGDSHEELKNSGSVPPVGLRFRPGSRALVDLPHSHTGRTPLMFAAMRGDAKIVDFLIMKAGCDICLKDFSGKTAMDLAVLLGHREVVTLLLSKGDDDADSIFEHTRRQAELNCENATTMLQLQVQKDLNTLLCSDWLPQSLVAFF